MAVAERVNKYKKKSTSASSSSSLSKRHTRATLSVEKFKPSKILWHYPFLIYGAKKIGKTTLLSKFPKAYAFMFEPNDSYELYKSDITNWADFKELVPQFLSGQHKFESCWIDNGRNAYELAQNFVCRKAGVEHPSEMNDYGQTWAKIYSELSLPVRQLMQSRFGFSVTCHEIEKEIETRTGRTFIQVVPDLSSAATRLFCGEIYNIFYYHYDGSDRFLQIVGDDYVMAGNRMKGHFLTTKGERVARIPMGNSEEEAFENLIKAYNNEQADAFIRRDNKERKEGSSRTKFKKAKAKA